MINVMKSKEHKRGARPSKIACRNHKETMQGLQSAQQVRNKARCKVVKQTVIQTKTQIDLEKDRGGPKRIKMIDLLI